jgi:hypothetical protein
MCVLVHHYVVDINDQKQQKTMAKCHLKSLLWFLNEGLLYMFHGLYRFFQSTTPLRGEHSEVGHFYLVHFHYI